MSTGIERRQTLKLALGAAVMGIPAGPVTAGTIGRGKGGDLPDVPGMLGDRRANELWFEFDNRSLFEAEQEVLDAYATIEERFGSLELGVWQFWVDVRMKGDYPHDYVDFWRPLRPQLKVISRMQLSVFDDYYRYNAIGLIEAFTDFGQGVLWDPRRRGKVHMMNGDPTSGYHVWHAYSRAMDFLNVDSLRWRWLEHLIGAAWEIQSVARPARDRPNQPIDRAVVRRITKQWLLRITEQIDEAFESYPYPIWMS